MSDSEVPGSSNNKTWAEPPWSGWIETTGDALLILEAARRGLIPRVTRRLVDSERKMITSGSVFVFDEDESGIKRWTDGYMWSPSRILGNFLIYRETNKKPPVRGKANAQLVGEDDDDGAASPAEDLPPADYVDASTGLDKLRERQLLGSLTNSVKFKPDGMMKKTFSLAIGGVSQHLISYYRVADVENGRLRAPSSLPELSSLEISPEYLDKNHFRLPPKIEIGEDGVPRYRGEAEETDLLLESDTKSKSKDNGKGKGRRYEPYNKDEAPKKGKKGKATKQSAKTKAKDKANHASSSAPAVSVPPNYPEGYPYGHYPYPGYPPYPYPSPYPPTNAGDSASTPAYNSAAYPAYYWPPSYGDDGEDDEEGGRDEDSNGEGEK